MDDLIERLTTKRSALHSDWLDAMDEAARRLAAVTAERDAALEAEDAVKDCFWAVYPTYIDAVGHGIGHVAAHNELTARLAAAEARLSQLEAALKPFAETGGALIAQSAGDRSPWVTAPDDTPYGNQGLTFGDLRAAYRALTSLDKKDDAP